MLIWIGFRETCWILAYFHSVCNDVNQLNPSWFRISVCIPVKSKSIGSENGLRPKETGKPNIQGAPGVYGITLCMG